MLGNKGVLIGSVITVILVVGGIFLFTKNSNNSTSNPKVISSDILTPQGVFITSGIQNGNYLPQNSSANVTLVEFGDYQCPACGAYSAITTKVLNDFAGKINYVFRDFAFIGPESNRATLATYCAADQNKYWQFHDYLYSHQSGENKGSFNDGNLKSFAKTLGLDTNVFNECFDSNKYQSKLDKSNADARLAGIESTPSFFINGVKIDNPGSADEFESLIKNALSSAPIVSASPSDSYHAHFDIKAYVNGVAVDFSLPKYQDSKNNKLSPDIHFHDGNGSLVHVHKAGVPLSELFRSIQYSFPVSTASTFMKVYVNGNLSSEGLSYIPKDLDQILITYGPANDTNIKNQISSVTDNACIYSLKCPDRGTPPPESCAGGLGTDCSD